MRFCALSTDQHRSLYKLIFKNILENKIFDLKTYSTELYNKVYSGTKNQELALTYASYVPMYVSNLASEDKDFRAILKTAKSDANELLDKIDEFDNNLQNVLNYLGVKQEAPSVSVEKVIPKGSNKVITPEIVDNTNPAIKKLESDRDKELSTLEKPKVKFNYINAETLLNSKNPASDKIEHDDIKNKGKELQKLINCLWQI